MWICECTVHTQYQIYCSNADIRKHYYYSRRSHCYARPVAVDWFIEIFAVKLAVNHCDNLFSCMRSPSNRFGVQKYYFLAPNTMPYHLSAVSIEIETDNKYISSFRSAAYPNRWHPNHSQFDKNWQTDWLIANRRKYLRKKSVSRATEEGAKREKKKTTPLTSIITHNIRRPFPLNGTTPQQHRTRSNASNDGRNVHAVHLSNIPDNRNATHTQRSTFILFFVAE